jgi:hypothetical protein
MYVYSNKSYIKSLQETIIINNKKSKIYSIKMRNQLVLGLVILSVFMIQ